MPDKLPRKEDLLQAQHKDNPTATVVETAKENSEVRKSKEAAEIAKNRAEQTEYETKTKLTESGYKSIEQGIVDIANKMKEADRILANAKQQEASIASELEHIAKEKGKVTSAYAVVKEREASANARLEEAVKLEIKLKEIYAKTEALKQEIKEIINFHNTYIAPCVKALIKSVNALDEVRGILKSPDHYDKASVLRYILNKCNFIGEQADKVDRYLDTVPEILKLK